MILRAKPFFSLVRPSSSSLQPYYCTRHGPDSTQPIISKPFSEIPGPKPRLLLGNLKEISELMKKRSPVENWENNPLSEFTRKYGNISKLELSFPVSRNIVLLNDADAVRDLLKNEGKIPVRSSSIEKKAAAIHEANKMPIGIIFAHKEEWKRLRSAIIKQVTPRRLTHYAEPLSTIADEVCDYFRQKRDSDGWMKDIWRPMQSWALKGSAKIILSQNIDAFSDVDSEAKEFVEAALDFVKALSKIEKIPEWFKILPTKQYKEYVKSMRNIKVLGSKIIKDHYNTLKDMNVYASADEEMPGTLGLLDQWLIEGKLSEEEALLQACDLLAAGIDTTSNTATFLLHELAKRPDIQEALYKEIQEVVGPHDSPTAEQLQRLHLVRRCVKETLRLYPLAGFMPREVPNDIVLLGYQIPAGTVCICNFYLMSKDPRYFDQPMEFDPDRWTHDPNPFASLPFGFGPRMCYGRRIAELELYIVLTRIMQKFKLSTDNQDTIRLGLETVLHPVEPVRVKFDDL